MWSTPGENHGLSLSLLSNISNELQVSSDDDRRRNVVVIEKPHRNHTLTTSITGDNETKLCWRVRELETRLLVMEEKLRFLLSKRDLRPIEVESPIGVLVDGGVV